MIQKLAVHPPRVEMLSRKRLFDLRTGHTKSNVSSDSPGPERVPTVLHSLPDTSLIIVVFIRSLVNGPAVFGPPPCRAERP